MPDQPAAVFLARLRAIVADYLDPEATGMAEVLAEVERLGTVDAVGGHLLAGPVLQRALRVNLEAASLREGRAGEGVLVADHRARRRAALRRGSCCAAPSRGCCRPGRAWTPWCRTPRGRRCARAIPIVEDAAAAGRARGATRPRGRSGRARRRW